MTDTSCNDQLLDFAASFLEKVERVAKSLESIDESLSNIYSRMSEPKAIPNEVKPSEEGDKEKTSEDEGVENWDEDQLQTALAEYVQKHQG